MGGICMSNTAQRAELQSQIWKIANEVRGSVDGWDFKQYVLGTLFYRFISENFSNYIEGGDESVNYAELDDKIITKEIIEDAIKTKGYFIYPSQLFSNIAKTANTNESLNTDLKTIFDAIENSASGYPSEQDIKGLFADFDTTSNRLGNTVKDKNARLAAVIKGVEGLDFGNFEDNQIDLFGDAYEYLISNYAANAGKSGGEFFTPQCVSELIAKLAIHGQTTINKIYDPAVGSGSLLLQAKKQFDEHLIEDGFFGQEINHTTYNLARMNMFLHNVNYDKFHIALGNTLTDPHFGGDKPFDAIVSNPPYSINWIGSDDPTLINDDRFAPAGVLAPKSKADFAFVLHCLSYLSGKGRAAIVCFPGIFYRGGAEQKIRKYLVDNNFVETIIALAPNLFYGTSIAVNILVLSKHKLDTKIQFIDASGQDFYKKETNNNVLTPEHIESIIQLFDSREDKKYISKIVDNDRVSEEKYNLSVSSYLEAKDTREIIDIDVLNSQIKTTVSNIDRLRAEIDKIIAEIEG
jgi:type I restriction enzyme M protein